MAKIQRIQGFPDWFVAHQDVKLAKKQFGNAVSPPVIFALVHKILETKIFDKDNVRQYEQEEETRNLG